MAIDPVCGMEVDEQTSTWRYEYQGKVYHFCDEGCLRSFEANPEKCLGSSHHHDHSSHTHHR